MDLQVAQLAGLVWIGLDWFASKPFNWLLRWFERWVGLECTVIAITTTDRGAEVPLLAAVLLLVLVPLRSLLLLELPPLMTEL